VNGPLRNEWLVAKDSWRIDFDVWVKDLTAAVPAYTERFGLGPWRYTELKAPVLHDARFRGEPVEVDMIAAISELGPMGIELLQVRGGSESVMRWVAEMPDGYWHPCAYHATVEQADEAFADLTKRGFSTVLSGRIAGSNFYMLDASDLFGRMVEVAGGPLSGIEWTSTPTGVEL
jgi:Glyoxalase/Bleomycin resistance protein/Dioxygenase superfamily